MIVNPNTTDSVRSSDPASNSQGVDWVSQNIHTVADLMERWERNVDGRQRAVETAAAFIGRPHFVGLISIFMIGWILWNLVAPALHLRAFDPPPFEWLQGVVSVGALYTTVIVIASQNRQSKVSEHRDHLELQAILLTEQKATKIIALLEELRRDSPNLANRPDPDADALQEHLDPSAVLTALEESLDN